MTVYADVLIIINAVIDFFILLTAQKLAHVECRTYRCILSSILGGLLSLYIFAPSYGTVINFTVWLLSCAIITLSVCGKKQISKYFKLLIGFVFTNAVYGGIVIAFWTLFKPKAMIIYNGIIYYHISPLILLVITILCYVAITLSERYLKLKAPTASRCKLTIYYNEKSNDFLAIIDTGHSLCDPFSEKSVIIVDKASAQNLFDTVEQSKYRLIPYNDISGRGVLHAFMAHKAQIELDNKLLTISKPIIAFAKKGMLPNDFNALLSPQILSQESERVRL